jgi:hypothetical protein
MFQIDVVSEVYSTSVLILEMWFGTYCQEIQTVEQTVLAVTCVLSIQEIPRSDLIWSTG